MSCAENWVWFVLGGLASVVVVIRTAAHSRGHWGDVLKWMYRPDLRPMEAEILAVLLQRGSPLSQARVNEAMGMAPNVIAAALDDLEKRGLVRRQWDSENQTDLVYLTLPAGREEDSRSCPGTCTNE